MSTRNSRTATAPPAGRGAGPAVGPDPQPVDAPQEAGPGAERQPGRGRGTRPAWLAVTVALAVVVVLLAMFAGVMATSEDATPSGGTPETSTRPAVGSQEYLDRLANQGYIPPDAVDRDLLLLERLVGRGDIPREALGSEADR
jgi:hypothetical protein